MKIVNSRYANNYIIAILTISTLALLNNLLNFYFVEKLYFYAIISFTFVLLSKCKKIYFSDLLLYGYVLYTFTINAFFSIYYGKIEPLVYSFTYIIYPFFWLLYFRSTRQQIDFRIVYIYVYSAFIISLLGIVQYFISSDLYGLLSHSKSNNIQWSIGLGLDEYVHFFRATSIFESPQVYGLYTSIAALLSYNYRNIISPTITLTIIIGTLLSGNKLSYIFILYVFLKFLYRQPPIIILLFLCVFLAVLLIQPINLTEFVAINRVFQLDSIVEEERSGRLSIYNSVVNEFFTFYGIGAGSLADSSVASESYLLQLIIENGVISFLLFVSVIVVAVWNLVKLK